MYIYFVKYNCICVYTLVIEYSSNAGVVITVAKPVFAGKNGVFRGVAGIDLKLSDLLSKLIYLNSIDSSYSFVIDSEGLINSISLIELIRSNILSIHTNNYFFIIGRTLYHPLLVSPEGTSNRDFVDIEFFEHDPKVKQVIANMKR